MMVGAAIAARYHSRVSELIRGHDSGTVRSPATLAIIATKVRTSPLEGSPDRTDAQRPFYSINGSVHAKVAISPRGPNRLPVRHESWEY
jgi:hypothetical protein